MHLQTWEFLQVLNKYLEKGQIKSFFSRETDCFCRALRKLSNTSLRNFPAIWVPQFPLCRLSMEVTAERWLKKRAQNIYRVLFWTGPTLKVLNMGIVPPNKKNDWLLLCVCYACLYVRDPSLGWILVWQRHRVEGSPIMGLPWAPIRPRQNHHSLRTRLLSSPWWWWRCWLCWWWWVMGQTHHSLRIFSSLSMATGTIQTINIAIFHH